MESHWNSDGGCCGSGARMDCWCHDQFQGVEFRMKTLVYLRPVRRPRIISMKALISLGIVFGLAAISLRAQPPDASTFSLAPGDVTEAIVDTSGSARLKVMLTPVKSEELQAFTELNLNKQGRIVVAGKVRSEPFI